MKKFLLLSVAATLTCSISYAKIWRVNNVPGITADFNNAQAAHDGAAAGDTIHLEPSTAAYGSIITIKRLVWISTGNFLTATPGLQYSATPGRLSGLTVNPGSENSVFSINSEYIYCTASNVSFIRCLANSSYLYLTAGASNCVVINCYVNGYLYVQSGSTNAIINNNIVTYDIAVDAGSSAVIVNNVLNTLGGGGQTINNSQFQNNIIDQLSSPTIFVNSNINNNIANINTLPAGNGNQNNVTMSDVFVNYQGANDVSFVLKGGSNPAVGTGYAGTNMGVFGGSSPFVLGLQPAVPAIYQLTAPAAPSGNTMTVTFSTKSNN